MTVPTREQEIAPRQLRASQEALKELTGAVVDALLRLDSVGRDKRIPEDVSVYLGKLANHLEMANDQARHFGLNMSFARMSNQVYRRRAALRQLSRGVGERSSTDL